MTVLVAGMMGALVTGVFGISLGIVMLICSKLEKYHHGFWSALIALMYIGFFIGLLGGR